MEKETVESTRGILIDFPDSGVDTVAWLKLNPEQAKEKSEKAMAEAMNNIEEMACRINALRDRIPQEFSQVEVEFGIKFNWELGALITKAGAEASINVTLTWSKTGS